MLILTGYGLRDSTPVAEKEVASEKHTPDIHTRYALIQHLCTVEMGPLGSNLGIPSVSSFSFTARLVFLD
jgi:hypothetical protein